jgi:hypothetical protein
MDEDYFISQEDNLEGQKQVLESFIIYLKSIIKAMENGHYNSKMTTEICTMIQDYYLKNADSSEEDKSNNYSENKSENESEVESKDESENESEVESKDESEVESKDEVDSEADTESSNESKTEKVNDENYNHIKKMLAKPNYDIEKNIKNFIANCYVY